MISSFRDDRRDYDGLSVAAHAYGTRLRRVILGAPSSGAEFIRMPAPTLPVGAAVRPGD